MLARLIIKENCTKCGISLKFETFSGLCGNCQLDHWQSLKGNPPKFRGISHSSFGDSKIDRCDFANRTRYAE